MKTSELYLNRPTWEYRYAFDMIAAALRATDGRALFVHSSPMHLVEMLKRCQQRLDCFDTTRQAVGWPAGARLWAWGPVEEVAPDRVEKGYSAIAWAEPQQESAQGIAKALAAAASVGATLDVIATTSLRRFLPAYRADPLPAVRPLAPGAAVRCLQSAGWRISELVVLHGPRSMTLGCLARCVDVLGRPDWADRCQFAIRRTYQEPTWLWPFAFLTLIRARAN